MPTASTLLPFSVPYSSSGASRGYLLEAMETSMQRRFLEIRFEKMRGHVQRVSASTVECKKKPSKRGFWVLVNHPLSALARLRSSEKSTYTT